MSNPPDRPDGRPSGGEPDPQDEADRFAAAWEQIVADLRSGPDPIGGEARPAEGSGSNGSGAGQSGAGGLSGHPTPPAENTDPAEQQVSPLQPGSSEGLARLFEPLRRAQDPPEPAPQRADPSAATADPTQPEPAAWNPKDWHDEGHFIPPPPPDIPEGTPLSRLAWVGTLGGPAVLLGAALTGIDLPQFVAIGAGLAALAGFATLVWLLPDSRGEDSGWDDGARL